MAEPKYSMRQHATDATGGTFTVSGPGVHDEITGMPDHVLQRALIEMLTRAYEAGKRTRSAEILGLLGGRQ